MQIFETTKQLVKWLGWPLEVRKTGLLWGKQIDEKKKGKPFAVSIGVEARKKTVNKVFSLSLIKKGEKGGKENIESSIPQIESEEQKALSWALSSLPGDYSKRSGEWYQSLGQKEEPTTTTTTYPSIVGILQRSSFEERSMARI